MIKFPFPRWAIKFISAKTAKEMYPPQYHRPGYDRLWGWFELSYSSFCVLPRVMMHDMPDEWQNKMAELLEEWNDTWVNRPDVKAFISLKDRTNRYVPIPDWMVNYRHPDKAKLESIRCRPAIKL